MAKVRHFFYIAQTALVVYYMGMPSIKSLSRDYALPAALAVAVLGLLGSLYFSEILHLPPCLLCWYQRILFYPLVPLLAIGYAVRDAKVWRYALPLSLLCMAVAFYHVLLYYGFIVVPESCSGGISCTTITWKILGFVTIPLLSLIGSSLISGLLLLQRKYSGFFS